MIPSLFAPDLPRACRQVLLITAPHETSVETELRLLSRLEDDWFQVGSSIPVVLGRGGLAWGCGEHQAKPPSNFRLKREGDGCSPAGIFALPSAFGESPIPSLKMPYQPITDTLIAVDDPKSCYYNQIIDTCDLAEVQRDWTSTEYMRREDGLYRYGLVVAHNFDNLPGMGSCIFMHLWRGPGVPTAGCTAMSEPNLLRVLEWLDSAHSPRLVQWVA